MKAYKIGIIGFGDFTKVMLEHLAPYADIVVSSRSKDSGEAGFGAQFGPLKDVLGQPIIIPSIPSQFFEEFFSENRDGINPAALVIDVCSVKVKPLAILEQLLPETCSIVGTHPMFGPASITKNKGLQGLKCVVCPTRVPDEVFTQVTDFLHAQLGLNVIHKTPEAHDREMAYVQGLSHYIGRVMDIMDIPNSELSTLAYDDLLDMKKIQGQDSFDLFQSIMHQNPYAAAINQGFKQACKALDNKLSKKSE